MGRITPSTLDNIVDDLQRNLNGYGNAWVSRPAAQAALSMESIDASVMGEIDSSLQNLNAALETIVADNKIINSVTVAQRDAAAVAGVLAGDINGFLKTPIVRNVAAMEGMTFIGNPIAAGSDFFDSRMRVALEAYDEKENKQAAVYSVAYNLQAARQDEFGEAFFPTIVVTPDQVGFAVTIRLVEVYNEVRRQVSGDVNNFARRNIIQAVIDPTILKNDQTKVVPVYSAESQAYFVPSSLVAPYDTLLDGETITTSMLAMGKKFSLLGISQTDALLETGLLDSTDSLDPAIKLDAVGLRLKGAALDGSEDEVLKFNTGAAPYSTFTYAVQDNYRLMNLAFSTSDLKVGPTKKLVDGSTSTLLAPVASGNLTVRLGVQVSGSVNLELATTSLFASDVEVVSITTEDGVKLAPTDATYITVKNIFAGAEIIGYDLEARRTNLNRRQRGQLLNTNYQNQVYAVPLRGPITVPRPLTSGDQTDSSDLAALITATHISNSNAAVDEVLRVNDVLAEYVNSADSVSDSPAVLGTGRYLVKPFHHYEALNVAEIIDSLTSHERAEDIQAVLVNKLRDVAYRMYRDSGYKAAADALAGGVAPVPTVIIGTDPVIARYLTVTGDLRTLGGSFNVKIVSTLNQRMAGKIVMTLGNFDTAAEGVVNPLHFGNMAWKPELTLVLPLHRNGQTSKELTVQPSYLHVTHLPILATFDISGIEEAAASKIAIHNVATVANPEDLVTP